MHLDSRKDHVLAGETAAWLERTDARVGIHRDGTVRLQTNAKVNDNENSEVLGQKAGDACLRSKQGLLRQEGFSPALTMEAAMRSG